MTDLFSNDYPNTPGHRGVETSIISAALLAPKLGPLQQTVLAAIRRAGPGGLTTDECVEVLNMERWRVQPRTSELRRKGAIGDSGRRRKSITGKPSIVWVASPNLNRGGV